METEKGLKIDEDSAIIANTLAALLFGTTALLLLLKLLDI